MPAAPTRAASIRAKFLLNLVLGGGFFLICVPVITRLWLHEWLSFAWVVLLFLHIVFAWGWVVSVSRRAVQSVRAFTSMRWQVQANFLWDVTLYVTTAIAMVSGVLVSMFALPQIGIKLPHDRFWAILHVSSAEWLMVMVGIHLALHWAWIKTTLLRLVRGSLGGGGRRDDGMTWWVQPLGIVTGVSLMASLATGALGKTPIAAAMREPPRRAMARANPTRPTAASAPTTPAPATAPAPAAPITAPSVAAAPSTPPGAAPSAQPAPAAAAPARPARPRPPRPPMSFARRTLQASRILGMWVGIPFVLAMVLLAFVERNRQSAKGGRGALALDAAD